MQKTGLEWIFRLLQEPKRLFKRYAVDLVVFGRAIATQWWALRHRPTHGSKSDAVGIKESIHGSSEIVRFGERLDAAAVEKYRDLLRLLRASEGNVLADLSQIQFIDSTGLGLLIRLLKQLRSDERQLILIAPSAPVVRALELMHVTSMFTTAPDIAAGQELIRVREGERPVGVDLDLSGRVGPLVWTGEVVAANVDAVWNMTQYYLELRNGSTTDVTIRLDGVRFIDSTGVRLMLKVRKHGVKLGMNVGFVSPTPAVLNVLRIVRLDNLLLR
jgi:N-acetylglucosaminyldiphosphoundecaprenol N-acetyl-beta-D-mannosaminyltransferase